MITASGEFVVNLPDEKMAHALDFCGVRSGRDTDKANETGLSFMPADGMATAPAVQGCPLSLCCKVRKTLELGSHDMFIGEVMSVMVRKDLLDAEGKLHLEKAGLIAYSHGLYQRLGEVIGFFGWSVAREEVFRRRMCDYR
jgi:flavin reductase (DIM6/NTAB) family NADH-FMN oxidoreductase RutF